MSYQPDLPIRELGWAAQPAGRRPKREMSPRSPSAAVVDFPRDDKRNESGRSPRPACWRLVRPLLHTNGDYFGRLGGTNCTPHSIRAWRARLVACGFGAAIRCLQGDGQQDRTRRGQSDCVIVVRLAGAFDLTLAGLLLRAVGEAGRLSRRASGAMPALATCA